MQDLASQMGRVFYSRHCGSIVPRRICAYRGSQLPSVFSLVVMHARNLMLRTPRSMVVISEAGCTVTWPTNVKRTKRYGMYGWLY